MYCYDMKEYIKCYSNMMKICKWNYFEIHFTLQSLYYATHYNMVLVITRSGLGSQMVIFL